VVNSSFKEFEGIEGNIKEFKMIFKEFKGIKKN
jgi:hypothetical protein